MSDRILRIPLRCGFCGNAVLVDRLPEWSDPPDAVECVSNECNICDAASGGWGEVWYFDANGHELAADDCVDMPEDTLP